MPRTKLTPVVLSLVLAFGISACDRTSSLTAEEHIQRAKDAMGQSDYKTSLIELKNADQKAPDNPGTHLLLAEAYLKSGYAEDAERELKRAQGLGVGAESVLPLLAESLLEQKQYQRVLDEILPPPQFSSLNRARLESARGDALIGLGKLQAGCELYAQSKTTNPKNIPAYWGLAACAKVTGDSQKSKDWLDQALAIEPQNARTLRLIAQQLFNEGKLKEAISGFEKALQIAPKDIGSLGQLGLAHLSEGDFKNTQKQIDKIERIAPGHPDAAYLKAFSLYLQKQPAQALPLIQQAVKVRPELPGYQLLLGTIQLDLGSLEQAGKAFSQVLAVLPGHIFARKLRAVTVMRQGNPDEALELLAPLLRQNPPDVSALKLAGDAEMSRGRWVEAENLYRQALSLKPGSAQLLTSLGQSEARQGQTQEALALFQEAAGKTGGREADIFIILTQLKARQYREALTSADNLIRKDPKLPQAHLLAAEVHSNLNQVAKAREHLQLALKLQPGSLPAVRALAHLYLKDKQPSQAQALWKDILERNPDNIEAMLALSDIALQAGNPKEANQWLARAQKASPDSAALVLRVASQQLQAGEPDKALATLKSAQQTHPKHAGLLGLMGEAQLALGDSENARISFQRAQKLSPHTPQWSHGLAQAEFGLSNFKVSRAHLEKLLNQAPQFYPAYSSLVLLHMREGRISDALKIAKQAQSQFPTQTEAQILEGDIHLAAKNWSQAADAYRRAQALAPDSQTLVKLHRAVSHNGALAQADGLLDKWIEQHPEDVRVRLARADLRLSRMDLPKAEADYREVLKINPDQLQALNNLAFIVQDRAPDQALQYAEKAYQLAPLQANILDTLGWLLTTSGRDLKRGTSLLSKAVELAPQVPVYRLHYAQALAKQNARSQARQQLAPLIRLKGPLGDKARNIEAELR